MDKDRKAQDMWVSAGNLKVYPLTLDTPDDTKKMTELVSWVLPEIPTYIM